jgi:hypothetical protein
MAHSRITQRRRLPPSTTWPQSTGTGGRNAPERLDESLVAMDRIGQLARSPIGSYQTMDRP